MERGGGVSSLLYFLGAALFDLALISSREPQIFLFSQLLLVWPRRHVHPSSLSSGQGLLPAQRVSGLSLLRLFLPGATRAPELGSPSST